MGKSNAAILIIILVLVGFGIFVWGTSENNKQEDSPASANEQVKIDEDQSKKYFSSSAKVMFFYSDGCSWCEKEEKEVLSKLGEVGYRVKPVDAEKNYDLFEKYKVEGTPTFIAPDGEKLVGFQEYDNLKKFLDKYK